MQGLGREMPGDARVWQVLAQLQALQGNDAAAADTFAHAFSLTSHQVRPEALWLRLFTVPF